MASLNKTADCRPMGQPYPISIIEMAEKAQIENYLEQKVNPLLEDLLTQVIKNKPRNILTYCKNWFDRRAETHPLPEDTDSDSDQEETTASELQSRRGREQWYSRRKGICGEVYGSHHLWEEFQPTIAHKKSTVNSRILFRLKSLFLFRDFDDAEMNRLITSMTEHKFGAGCWVFHEGQSGLDMYVVDSGELECLRGPTAQETVVRCFREGEMFGEMAMLYNTPRWASVRAKTNCVLFKLERKTYHSLVNERNLRKRKVVQAGLLKIEALKELEPEERLRLEDVVKEIPIHLNQYVLREGRPSKTLYIIESGKFVSLKREKSGHDKIVEQFKEGDVFGQGALLSTQPAAESVISLTNGKLLGIERQALERVLGPTHKIIKRSLQIYERYKHHDLTA